MQTDFAARTSGSATADGSNPIGCTTTYGEILTRWAAGKLSQWQVNVCHLEMAVARISSEVHQQTDSARRFRPPSKVAPAAHPSAALKNPTDAQ